MPAPKFFIPAATDADQAERVYAAVKQFAAAQTGRTILDRRVYRLQYMHNGKAHDAMIGGSEYGEIVVAILDAADLYVVCTENRCVLREEPILVGRGDVVAIEEFARGAANGRSRSNADRGGFSPASRA